MQILLDFFPIIMFFIAFKFGGIFIATIIAMIASLLQVSITWFRHRKFQFIQVLSLLIILLLGGATLLSHKTIFIQWKPTIIYWFLAAIFLFTQFFGEKKLIQRIMDNKILLSKPIWSKLNLSWVAFCAVIGFVNLYVVYNFSTNAWVNFKLFGILGLTTAFVIVQSFYMAKHVKQDKDFSEQVI